MDQKTNRAVIGYHAGLNITASMLFINGCCYLWYCRYWTSCIRCFYDHDLIINQEKLRRIKNKGMVHLNVLQPVDKVVRQKKRK